MLSSWLVCEPISSAHRGSGIPEVRHPCLKMPHSPWILSDGLAKCGCSGWKLSAFRIWAPSSFLGVSPAISSKVAYIRFQNGIFCMKTLPVEFCGHFFLNPDLETLVNVWVICRSFRSGSPPLSFFFVFFFMSSADLERPVQQWFPTFLML